MDDADNAEKASSACPFRDLGPGDIWSYPDAVYRIVGNPCSLWRKVPLESTSSYNFLQA